MRWRRPESCGAQMRLEPKLAPSLAATMLYPVAALAATVVIASLLALAAGASPFFRVFSRCQGCCGFAIRGAGNADPGNTADLHRAGSRRRLPRQAVEHRRRGTALCGGRRYRGARYRRAAIAGLHAAAGHRHCRHGRGRTAAAWSGTAQDALRCRRGGDDAPA